MTPAKTEDETIFTPVEPFTGDLAGVPFVANPGQKFAANHPAVKQWPFHFIEFEASDAEVQARLAERAAEAEAEIRRDRAAAPRDLVTREVPVEKKVINAGPSYYTDAGYGTVFVPTGQVLADDDQRIAGHEGQFKPLSEVFPEASA
jgi:hypothetical protein